VTFVGYGGLPSHAQRGGESGVQLSDSTLMHAGVGSEIGYDSNVYYTDTASGATTGAGILRILPFIEITNASRTGEAPSSVYFDANASLLYREYIASDQIAPNVKRAFMPSVGVSGEFGGNQALDLTLADSFTRIEDPPYGLTGGVNNEPIIRNSNQAFAQLRLMPGGGRLQGVIRYTNGIDIFGDTTQTYDFADSMSHELMLDFSWKWLPKTAIFVQARQGYVQYFHPNGINKSSSFPLHAIVGLRGLITEKLTLALSIGYTNGFYSDSRSTGGFLGSSYAAADVTYHPLLTTIVMLGYRHDFQNSVISNFYYVDGVYATIQQQLLARISLSLSGRWEHRNFQFINVPVGSANTALSRVDDFFQVGATADVSIKAGFYAGVGYSLLANKSDFVATMAGQLSPQYVKHQVFGRLGVTY